MSTSAERARQRRRNKVSQLFAYLLIVSIGVYGFYELEQGQYERCVSGNEIRQVNRDNVVAIYDLGTALTRPPVNGRQTEFEEQEARRLAENLERFRDNQLEMIPSDRECETGWLQ